MINFIFETITYYYIWSSVIGVASIIAMYFALSYLWKFFHIILTPTTKIDSLKPGKVEIKGRVDAINHVSGTDRKAVYYKKLDEHYKSGKNGGWKTTSVNHEYVYFKVADDTGEVIVKPDDKNVFDIKYDTVNHSKTTRTRYFYLDDKEKVYVLGSYDGEIITRDETMPFIISDYEEADLVVKHGLVGFGITLAVIALVSVAFYFASFEWEKEWQGRVTNKYSYESGSGKNRSTHYVFKLEGGWQQEVSSREYDRVTFGDYVTKKKEQYELDIKTGY